MVETRTRRASKLTAIILSLMMVVVFMPTFAFAAETDGITVYMTISDQGELAKANDGSAMAWKEVTVKDTDDDGQYTFDEALKAAHEAYNSADGYATGTYGVAKLWGTETTNCLMFVNNKGLSSGVTADTVSDGDKLVASINKDGKYYADWYSYLESSETDVAVGDSVTLTLKGYQGMTSYLNPEPAAAAGVNIKTTDGTALGTTDDEGQLSVSFNEPGTYIITAEGTVKDTVTDYNLMSLASDGGAPFGTMDLETAESTVAYTDADYGDGPYPADEIKYYDFFEEDEDPDCEYDYVWQSLNYIKSTQLIADCPIIAPACVVNVYESIAEDADVTVTVNNKGDFAKAKDGSVVVEKDVTVKDINKDGHLTFNEALVAAHKAYYTEGEAGFVVGGAYNSIQKLWGVDTTNVLSYINNVGIYSVDDEVKEGDAIYASINADDTYYADWYTSFANTKETVAAPAPISSADFYATFDVQLVGHYGMAYTEEDLKDVPLEGIQIGYLKDGEFVAIDGAVTDADGKATVCLKKPEAGTYILTAKGTVKDEVQDWSAGGALVEADCPIMAPYEFVEVEYKLASKVDEQKAEAIKDLVASCDLSEYKAAEQIKALAIIVKAQADLASANSASAIESILAAAKEEIAALKTAEQYKDEAKAKVAATKVKGVKAKAGAKKATVSWTKNSVFAGYQIYYKVKGTSKWKSATATGKSKVIKSLKKGKRYQFKVRGYKAFDGKKTYGKWSVVKTIKIK